MRPMSKRQVVRCFESVIRLDGWSRIEQAAESGRHCKSGHISWEKLAHIRAQLVDIADLVSGHTRLCEQALRTQQAESRVLDSEVAASSSCQVDAIDHIRS